MENNWISVKDKLPENDIHKELILYSEYLGIIHKGCYYDNKNFQDKNEWFDDITHWMPLPKPPKNL